MAILFCTILGGFMNAVRGGVFSPWPYGKSLNIAVFAAFCGFFVEFWWQVPLCALAMWIGQAPSVGEIIGEDGILGGNGNEKIHGLAMQRGMFWGGFIALATWSIFPLIAGVCFGVCYEIARFCGKLFPKLNTWLLGEIIFGALLWGSVYV